jgi:hydroxycarboxylate dehydrogenase B
MWAPAQATEAAWIAGQACPELVEAARNDSQGTWSTLMSKNFSAAALRSQVAGILSAAGSSAEEARTVAENLVLANLSGHDSHGVGMVPRYVDAVLEGGLKPNAGAKLTLDGGALLALDGQRGYGQVVGEQAMAQAMARAKSLGTCVMALANAHHLGRIGHFAEMATQQGLVAIHFVNVLSRPTVAPWGGADGRFGTNPCCVGIPLAGREPFLLDFATSRVAQGKMRVAHNEHRQVEPGYLIDPHGRPTTDPSVVVVPQASEDGAGLFGALLPFGEHKGYGLAVACELLGGALTGSGTWHRPADTARSVINGMLTIVIDPQKLGTQASFEKEALAFIDWLKQSPPAPGSDGVRMAGEPEREARAQRERAGIVIDDQTWAEIVAAGAMVGFTGLS